MRTLTFDMVAVGIMTIVATAVFGIVLAHAVGYAPEAELSGLFPPPAASALATSSPGLMPAHIAIPSIGVDAAVQQVGISVKGNIGIPTNFTDVAWYKYGPKPGTQGTAIFDGHVDNGLGLDGVFKRLVDLKKGDEIFVRTTDGTAVQFVVYDSRSYYYTDVPMRDLLAPRKDAELVLISCNGGWVAGERTYDHRLVVYARMVRAS